MIQTEFVDKIETYFTINNFFSENHGVYDVMWKRMVDQDRPQTTIQYGTCALLAAYRHTVRVYNNSCFCTATVVTRARLNVTLQVRCVSCYLPQGSLRTGYWKTLLHIIILSQTAALLPLSVGGVL